MLINFRPNKLIIRYTKDYHAKYWGKQYRQDTIDNFEGFYIGCNLYSLMHDFPFVLVDIVLYGQCDNASQIYKYHNNLLLQKNKYYFVLMHPIIRNLQSSLDGWKWRLGGKYIGKYKITDEFLYNEHIDYIWSYKIFEVEVKKDEWYDTNAGISYFRGQY